MKVALLGDVHANLPALQSVLSESHEWGADAVWNLGDFLGYGPFPDEVVARLRTEPCISIIGNYDRKVIEFPRKKEKWRRTKQPRKYEAFRWAHQKLSAENRCYLESLPDQRMIDAEGLRIRLTHGSPDSISEHLTPDTPAARLEELALAAGANVIACGHSHVPFARQSGAVWFVNPGSVGRPEGGDPRAGYAQLEFSRGRFGVRHRRVAYDVQRCAEAIRAAGLPEEFAQMLILGKNLDQVREGAMSHDPNDSPRETSGSQSPADPLAAVHELARQCDDEQEHSDQVTRLALRLFDELEPVHGLGTTERFHLQCGALLHDIGWVEGQPKHHKTSLRLILESPLLLFDKRVRRIVGLVARYHRKALPRPDHPEFARCDDVDRREVSLLAGVLRVADGLDRTHLCRVEDVACRTGGEELLIECRTNGSAEEEHWAASKKADLLARVLDRPVIIRMIGGE